jgi:signal transduction histidine kinase
LAALIEADRAEILTAYERRLKESGSPVAGEPLSLSQAIANASQIIVDVVASVRAGGVRIDRRYKLLSWTIGETRAGDRVSPPHSLQAAVAFFDVVVASTARHVDHRPDMLPSFVTAVLALNESISTRIREATLAYTGYLLDEVERAHLGERRRVARELHDRLGEGLSVALRQLELNDLIGAEEPLKAAARSALAKDAIGEAMLRLRTVTSDLRQEPVTSLEKALIEYRDAIEGEDVVLRLRVSGDEAWAPRTVLDESFLILREAIRNAVTHGDPTMVLIGVEFAPYQVRAWVEDDGSGFEHDAGTASATGIGLDSMRERATLLGGRLAVSSRPGHGTHVELLIPLPGHRDESSR